jgi:hypothetical protein
MHANRTCQHWPLYHGRRTPHPQVALLLLLLVALPFEAAESQITTRIGQTVKQQLADRKQKSEDSLVSQIASQADSVIEKGAKPIDQMIARTIEGIDSIMLKSYHAIIGSESEMDRELREALQQGRVDLDLGFVAGGTAFSPDGEALIEALARVLRKSKDDFILEGRYAKGEDKVLGRKRGLAVMVRLSELEVNTEQLHLVPHAGVSPDRSLGVIPVR